MSIRIPKIRVFQRSQHSWWVEFYWKSQRFPWPAGETEQDAKLLKSKIEICISEGRFEGRRSDVQPELLQAAPIATKRLTMDKLLDEFLVTKARKKSYSFYDHTCEIMRPSLGKKYVDSVSERDIKVFMDARSAEVSASTWNNTLVVLKMALEHARALGYIKASPADGIKKARNRKRREFFATKEQFETLLAKSPGWLHPLLITAVHTGGRQGECLGLQWEDVDLKAKQIVFRDTKNGDDRAVNMSDDLVTTLKELPSRFLGGSVFRDPELVDDAKAPVTLTKQVVRRPFEAAVTASKLVQIVKNEEGKREEVGFHFHDLRHTWASWQVQGGTSIYKLMKLGGWKSEGMVMRYAHFAPEHLAEGADVLNRLFSKSTALPPHSAVSGTESPMAPKG